MKVCKGINKAKGFGGCGELSDNRKYGLCPNCFKKWIYSTPEGGEWLQKNIIPRAKKKVARERKKRDKQAKIDLLSGSAFRSKFLQPKINLIARLIDFGQPCIATKTFGQMHGGHYLSVGSNLTTALNLHNIHVQSAHSNKWKAGDPIKYREGIIEIYGKKYMEFMDGLKATPALRLSKPELEELYTTASYIALELNKTKRARLPKERILLRNEINKTLGIYSEEWGVYSL